MNEKEACAKHAMQYINNGMMVGLGGGRTIAFLANFIAMSELDIRVVTPSFETEKLCVELGLQVMPLRSVSHVDVAFDGCDEVDYNLFALKSGGGIHTLEKLIANMADEYILLVDKSKVSKHLSFHCPIVIELLEDSLAYVQATLLAMGGDVVIKSSPEKYGPLKSDYGNVLLDVRFPKVLDPKALNIQLKSLSGVIDTSLLTNEVTKVVIAVNNGFEYIEAAVN